MLKLKKDGLGRDRRALSIHRKIVGIATTPLRHARARYLDGRRVADHILFMSEIKSICVYCASGPGTIPSLHTRRETARVFRTNAYRLRRALRRRHGRHREAFVEIYEATPEQQLVTTVEVLSLSNKRPDTPGWELYQRKRQSLLRGGVGLVESDLWRGGRRMPSSTLPTERLMKKFLKRSSISSDSIKLRLFF